MIIQHVTSNVTNKPKCPHCGMLIPDRVLMAISIYEDSATFYTCDTDEGGCDKRFALHHSAEVRHNFVVGTIKWGA